MVAGLAAKNKPSNPPKSPFFKGGLFEPPFEKGGQGGFVIVWVKLPLSMQSFNLAAQAGKPVPPNTKKLKTQNSKLETRN